MSHFNNGDKVRVKRAPWIGGEVIGFEPAFARYEFVTKEGTHYVYFDTSLELGEPWVPKKEASDG